MAQIDPWSIEYSTECYAAVEAEIGFHCGRIKGWKLYSLENPDLYRTLNQSPSEILAAFETQEELEQWREDLYKEPEPEKKQDYNLFNQPQDDIQLKTIGSGPNKLVISQVL
ncbi:hypothetical protein [Pontibacter russatus]|uniref:hypothetical protein n=1 Tax=Pontibacter russatus TaxID=2694929 RepID=UPI00137B7214|nr:hypothetical protein [Pontibacter russatus]